MSLTAPKKSLLKKKGSTTQKSLWKNDSTELTAIFEKLNNLYFNGRLKTKIMWARMGQNRARCYRRLGCYIPTKNLIKIHPLLGGSEIPSYFIEYVVYHEMLHAVYPPIMGGKRRIIHHRKFLEMEQLFSEYKQAKAWENSVGKTQFF